jgi:hypothetical protein
MAYVKVFHFYLSFAGMIYIANHTSNAAVTTMRTSQTFRCRKNQTFRCLAPYADLIAIPV